MTVIFRFLMLFIAAMLFAPPVYAQTINDAVNAAIEHHPSVLSARAAVDVNAQEIHESESNYYPELSVTGQGGRVFGNNSSSRGSITTRGSAYSYLFEGSVKARQMIFDGSESGHRVEAAMAKTKSARFNVADVAENLALSTVQAYVDLLRAREGYEMLKAHEVVVLDYIERISNMVDEGATDDAELQQARDINIVLDGLINDYLGQIKVAEANYYEVTGGSPPEKLMDPVPRIDMIPNGVEAGLIHVLETHPSLKSAAQEAQSLSFEAEAEQSVLMPDVDGELSYLQRDQAEELGGELVDARAVLRLNWSYETGGGQMARIRKKRHEHNEAIARLHELERQIERQARQAFAEYETSIVQVANQDKRTILNEQLFETFKVQFEGARITLLQLVQSENQLFTTRLERMNGRYRLLAAQYGVLASMGRLRESLDLTLAQADQ